MGSLTMMAGLGDTFMPDMAMIQQMIQMADADPNDGDTAMPPMNAALLKTIFASADPHFIQPIDMTMRDFGTMRWDPSTFDTTITTPAMGWTIIKEIEWAKQFHVDDHFGTPTDDFGAQWRFVGMVIMAEAKMQAQYALQMLTDGQGLIHNSNGAVDWAGQWIMLEALSDLASALDAPTMLHSTTNRYADPGPRLPCSARRRTCCSAPCAPTARLASRNCRWPCRRCPGTQPPNMTPVGKPRPLRSCTGTATLWPS
ncbi:MAG: hypothetical protein V9H69_19540 [Anaerolineae bacterium]